MVFRQHRINIINLIHRRAHRITRLPMTLTPLAKPTVNTDKFLGDRSPPLNRRLIRRTLQTSLSDNRTEPLQRLRQPIQGSPYQAGLILVAID